MSFFTILALSEAETSFRIYKEYNTYIYKSEEDDPI